MTNTLCIIGYSIYRYFLSLTIQHVQITNKNVINLKKRRRFSHLQMAINYKQKITSMLKRFACATFVKKKKKRLTCTCNLQQFQFSSHKESIFCKISFCALLLVTEVILVFLLDSLTSGIFWQTIKIKTLQCSKMPLIHITKVGMCKFFIQIQVNATKAGQGYKCHLHALQCADQNSWGKDSRVNFQKASDLTQLNEVNSLYILVQSLLWFVY